MRPAPRSTRRSARLNSRLVALAAAAAMVAVVPLPAALGNDDPTAKDSADDKVAQLYADLNAGPGLDGLPIPVDEFRPVEQAQQLVKGPGGQSVPVRLAPADTGGSLETLDGYTVLRGEDGTWRYAEKSKDGGLVPSTAVAGRDPVPTGVAPQLGRVVGGPPTAEEQAEAQHHAEMLRQMQIASRAAQEGASVEEPRVFTFPVLMLATWWDAEAEQSQPQFQEGNDAEHFTRLLDGFGGNPTGTMTEFYFEDSFGTFLVKVDVHGPFTSQRSREDRCYYGGIEPGDDGRTDLDLIDDALGIGGGGALGMAVEAVPQADPGVDFSKYDNDGDGVVDFVGIVHSGPDMAVTGDPCHTWSHAIQATLANGIVEGAAGLEPGSLPVQGLPTSDGVFVDRLFTMPEFDEPGSQLAIGVATHEMAHALGEPDYYNTAYTSTGTGNWDIMAGGSYGGNPSGSNPIGFNPASRVFQGWITPTIVEDDLREVVVQPRHIRPEGFDPSKPSPTLYLVPTKEIAVGEEDETGHVWTETDVYGLAQNPRTEKYVIEGYYIENINRMVSRAPIHPDMSRSPYFDRAAEGSGIMVWHFDYWLRSNVYYGSNNAQTDENRPQMDPVEFDFNDNTQELQLNKGRGNADDVMFSAATGITSGTRMLPPGAPPYVEGEPSEAIAFSGVVPPTQTSDYEFTYERNEADRAMTVTVQGTGDCTLQLLKDGEPLGPPVDGAFEGPETITVNDPETATWTARVGDFAACSAYDGEVTFSGSDGTLDTRGAGDTWSNWTRKPTGWAFTNVGPAAASGLDHAADAGGNEAITLDIVNLGADESDVSPGFVTGAPNERGGTTSATAGTASAMTVPVFNNGGKDIASADVVVRDGSGAQVASGTVTDLAGYSRKAFDFTWTPGAEGFDTLTVSVTAAGDALENNTQATELWAGPANPRVLVVDDDGALDQEAAATGALAALGVPYAVVTEHPTAAELSAHEAVIWEASQDRAVGQLDAGDVDALTAYLDGGGKLLMSSNRVVDALSTPPGRTNPGASENGAAFAAGYLGAVPSSTGPETENDDVSVTAAGPLGSATHRVTQSPGRHFLGSMSVAPEATEDTPGPHGTVEPVMTMENAPEGDHLGVAVTGTADKGGFRTITLGYNLAQHTSADSTTAIVRGALGFFGVATGAPLASSAEPVVHHASVRNQVSGRPIDVRAVVLGGQADSPVLLHYRPHGTGPFTTVPMQRGAEPGSYAAQIPGSVVTPQSVDYYLQAGSATTYDPPAARNQSVLHAVAVPLPEQPAPGAPGPAPGAPPAAPPAAAPPAGGPAPGGAAPTTVAQNRTLPATGGSVPLALAAALMLGTAGVVLRLRRSAGV